jgi:hypothetical protein
VLSAREEMDIIAAYQEVGRCGAPRRCAARVTRQSGGRWPAMRPGWPGRRRRPGGNGPGTTTTCGIWWPSGSRPPRAGSRPSGCCRRRRRLAIPDRLGTSAGWSASEEHVALPAPPGPPARGVVAGRDAGHRLGHRGEAARVLRRVGLESVPVCPSRSRRGAGDHAGAAGRVPRRTRRSAEGGAVGPDGLRQGRGGGRGGGADPGLRPLRHPLRVPPGFLSRRPWTGTAW